MAAAKAKRKRKGQKRVVDFSGWHWDASTPEQRAHRTWRMTERGETDPDTGKKRNPNDVRGVEFLTWIEIYAAQGEIEMHHLDAAWEYERLAREHRGSPAQRSCLDHSPIGHDEPDVNPRDAELWGDVQRVLGVFERAELDRTIWRGEPTARMQLLRSGLEKVADIFGF